MAHTLDLVQLIGAGPALSVEGDPTKQMSSDPASILGNATDDLGTMLLKLPEYAIKVITDALTGGVQTLEQWVEQIPGIGPFVSAITGELGNLGDLSNWFGGLESMLGFPDFGSGSFDPVTAVENFVTSLVQPTGLLASLENGLLSIFNIPGLDGSKITSGAISTDFIPGLQGLTKDFQDVLALLGNPSGIGTGSPQLSAVLNDIPLFGPFIDQLYNSITNNNATGISLGALGSELGQLATNVETALANAAQSFNVTQTFGALLHQVVDGLEASPIYQGPLDFLTQIENVVGTVWNQIVTSLTPANPAVVQSAGQINYIMAHLNPSAQNYRYMFNGSVALGANYAGPPPTTNPAFTAPTGFSVPAVPSGADYFYDNSGPTIGVATGNPSASATDHSLITDRVHMEMTVKGLSNGAAEFFICGNGTTGLGQHVSVRLHYQYEFFYYVTDLSIITYTGPMSGPTVRWSAGFGQGIKVGDVIAIEYDNAGNFEVFLNGNGVGDWPDSGGVVNHGTGNREIGIKGNVTNNNPAFLFGGGTGPNLGGLVAYDY